MKYSFNFPNGEWVNIIYRPKYNKWYGYYHGHRFAVGDIFQVYCQMLIKYDNEIHFIPPIKNINLIEDDDF